MVCWVLGLLLPWKVLIFLSGYLLFWAFKSTGKRRRFGACFLLVLLWGAFAMGTFSRPLMKVPSTNFIGVTIDCKHYKNNWKVLECLSLEDGQRVVLRGRHGGSIKEGDTLLALDTEFKELPLPSYLGEFNQRSYMAGKGIYYEGFFKNIRVIDAMKESEKQTVLEGLFNIIPEVHRPLMKGMLTGDKSDLSKETKHAFKACGIMHILAVSGMHVGLLSAIPIWLISRLSKRHRRFGIVLKLTTIFGLWCFAWFVGMGPSVVRASIMFSILIFALKKSLIQQFNVLCLTAWFMLVIQPMWLFDIGFQLSFSAVFGILFITPQFQALCIGCNRRLSKLLDAVCISLGAQLTTAPLVLYYFNEFPSYFLLGNLLVVPLLVIGIYLSLLVLILFAFDIRWKFLVGLLEELLDAAMWLSSNIASFPMPFLNGFFLSSSTVVICYVILLWALRRLENKGNIFFLLSRCAVMLLAWSILINIDIVMGMPKSERKDAENIIIHSKNMVLLVTRNHRESDTYLVEKLEEIHSKPCQELQLSKRQWQLLVKD